MKLPSFKRIFKTDYPKDVQPFIEKLAGTLNTAIEAIMNVLNKRVSLRDNIQCTVRDVEVEVNSSGNPIVTTGISLDVDGRVDGFDVLRVENLSVPTVYPEGAPFISFTQSENSVIFNNIKGLQDGYIWRIRVVAWQS